MDKIKSIWNWVVWVENAAAGQIESHPHVTFWLVVAVAAAGVVL